MTSSKIYSSTPVNKGTAWVVNQSGCEDNIFNNDKERFKDLCQQKTYYSYLCLELKNEIGINRKINYDRVPIHIRRHPKFSTLMGIVIKLRELDKEIKKSKDAIKHTPDHYPSKFVALVKYYYPEIYKEISERIKNNVDNQK